MSTTSNEIRLSTLIAPKFVPVHKAIKAGDYSEYWLKGGRGSTKSSFIAIQIIKGLIADPDANALALRKVGNTLRRSVFETLLWAIDKLGVAHLFSSIQSPPEITYLPTGQKVLMTGLDDPLKLKSIKIKKGYFKFLWFEEGAEYDGPEEIRSVEQSVLRGGDDFVEFVSYNPPNDPAAWVNKECEAKTPGRMVHSSTYLDVDPSWLGKVFIEKALTLKERDEEAYNHEYLGLAVGRAEQIIFHGKWELREFKTPEKVRFFFGVDWGFANDPTVLTRSFVEDEVLYVDHEAYGYHVEIDETPQLFDSISGSRKWPLKADCARPETISYIRRKGFQISAAEKWKGSVEDGIAHLKGFKKIVVHPRCPKLAEEFRLYSYKVDPVTKDVLPIIVDDWNHGIDSLRYALDGYIHKRGGLGVWKKLAEN